MAGYGGGQEIQALRAAEEAAQRELQAAAEGGS